MTRPRACTCGHPAYRHLRDSGICSHPTCECPRFGSKLVIDEWHHIDVAPGRALLVRIQRESRRSNIRALTPDEARRRVMQAAAHYEGQTPIGSATPNPDGTLT